MIKAIFFARFHPEKGNIIAHQVPPGAIATSSAATRAASPPSLPSPQMAASDEYPLFDFTPISSLIIPRQEFCDRLVTCCVNQYRVIGHPVCITSDKYERNEFIFNLAVVVDEDAEFSAYVGVVTKLARMLRQLEEQSRFLSREEKEGGSEWGAGSVKSSNARLATVNMEGSGELEKLPLLDELVEQEMSGSGLLDACEREQGRKVYALCEMIMEDLNNYCECMIPIDPSNTINLKLFPNRSPPAPVYAWHVPLSTVDLTTIAQSSDLTLTRILPYIDGIASVHQISQLADTDLGLTRKAIQHLLYYGCVLLLDIFQFGAIYAPTAEMSSFIEDPEAQEEAVRYVCMGTYRRLREGESTDAGSTNEEWGWRSHEIGIDRARLVQLYTTLRQGQTLKHWCSDNNMLLSGVDVRRFITFGIIKGFLYRVHKYVVSPSVLGGTATPQSHHSRQSHHRYQVSFHDPETIYRRYSIPAGIAGRESIGGLYSRRPSIDGDAGDYHPPHKGASHYNGRNGGDDKLSLTKYVDGLHCLDEVCTELGMSEKKVLEKMKAAFPDLAVVNR